jgi:2,3-dihydroxybenzoate decarboxylase
MDKAGIDLAVLSLFQPGIQGERDTATAIRKAKAVNDTPAERIAKHPARFRGFAAVPMQDPREAADELERAVKELEFKGALINATPRASISMARAACRSGSASRRSTCRSTSTRRTR